MTTRFATQAEEDSWNNLVIANPNGGAVFQTHEFAQIKNSNNWKPRYIVIDDVYILALERKITFLGSFWYVPKGPGITSVKELKQILPSLRNFAKNNGVFAVKLEPELLETPENIKSLVGLGLRKSKAIQAANTVIVDISKPIEDIMANFSSKARGNIRAAQKANVTTEIVPVSDNNCALFYKMMAQTIGGRSHVRNFEYFKNFWQSHYKSGTGVFMFAKLADEVLAMDFIMIFGKKAARKDAASTRDHSVRGASALLELEAIKYLKEKGVTQYDLYGAPPSDQIKNPNHPYYGFGTFKVGFNSNITDYVGCYDLVVKPFAYKLWQKFGERVAHRIYYYRHNDLYY
jgi:lipid II:glycine glycyltransferase (peptidoglycan interpeptide bridge formation enzyme)